MVIWLAGLAVRHLMKGKGYMEMYSVVPDNKRMETRTNTENTKVAVLVNLFYEDQVEYCKSYLERLPDKMDIVIISSKQDILDKFQENRYTKIKKENRGRDISALLVAAKTIIFRYQYICFVHDKREKCPGDKEYVDLWRKNIWDNMLKSPEYVYNILDLFEENDRLGIMVPLPPHKGDRGAWLKGSWGDTFECIRNLACDLGITVDICYEKPPITYSTVFWARTTVLEKLFLKDWKYTDFPDEPMRDNGEINHAVERIFQYLVEDAGYETKIALSSTFVSSFIIQIRNEMNKMWDQMGEVFGIRNYRQMEEYRLRVEKVKQFRKKYSALYLYGAGRAGEDCLKMCSMLDIELEGILVTEMKNGQTDMDGIRILPLADFVRLYDTGIIISVYNDSYQHEIIRELDQIGFREYMVF